MFPPSTFPVAALFGISSICSNRKGHLDEGILPFPVPGIKPIFYLCQWRLILSAVTGGVDIHSPHSASPILSLRNEPKIKRVKALGHTCLPVLVQLTLTGDFLGTKE